MGTRNPRARKNCKAKRKVRDRLAKQKLVPSMGCHAYHTALALSMLQRILRIECCDTESI